MSCVLLLVVDSKKRKEKLPHKLFTTKFVDVLNNRVMIPGKTRKRKVFLAPKITPAPK